ncbi:uncharacterized protein LOC113344363 [Papaver somniferum]|uniref:uncharacterized protein LOC113344363 n=1 Tax=Papaver somniferum TaxID=3469 RepID=UPI000E6FADDE|nr:uncharacterized protein LOC113344363 [Papaver somniferum]
MLPSSKLTKVLLYQKVGPDRTDLKKNSSLSALRITVPNSNSSSDDTNKESHKRKTSHNKEVSDCEIGGVKKSKVNKNRKPTVMKLNLSILDFDVADVTPLATIQTSDTNASITFEEIFPGEKEPAADQGRKDIFITASASSSDANQTSSSFIHTNPQPNSVNHETSLKELKTQNEKIIQSKINLNAKKNQLQEQYNQLKKSHDVLKKKNKSLSADEKKIRSRLNGSVGDDFDKAMESMKNNTLLLSKFCEDSEKSHQSTIAQLIFDLSKIRKERLNLELYLAASRDRARRRLAHQQSFLEINARNLEMGDIRKAHASAQSVVNGILLRNSLPAVKIPPLNVGEDEEYPEPDSDYEFVSDDEKDQEDEQDQIEKDKSVDKTNAQIENSGSNIDVEKSLVEQDVVAEHF